MALKNNCFFAASLNRNRHFVLWIQGWFTGFDPDLINFRKFWILQRGVFKAGQGEYKWGESPLPLKDIYILKRERERERGRHCSLQYVIKKQQAAARGLRGYNAKIIWASDRQTDLQSGLQSCLLQLKMSSQKLYLNDLFSIFGHFYIPGFGSGISTELPRSNRYTQLWSTAGNRYTQLWSNAGNRYTQLWSNAGNQRYKLFFL